MRGRRAAVFMALALAAGCGGSGSGSGTTAASPVVPPGELAAVATQTRFDQVDDHLFEITLTNTGGRPFTVTSVRLDAPAFAPVAASVRDEPFPPSITYDMPAHYGAARCTVRVGGATAVVELHRDGGPTGTVRVPLASPDGLLTRLHEQDCARQALARQVDVALADARQDGLDLRAVVRVTRTGSTAAIDAVELRNSKQFAFTAILPQHLDAGAHVLNVPVVVRPTACYGHLIGDVKQPYLFPLFLRFAGGDPQYIEVATSEEQHGQLQALLRTACAGRTQ